MKPINWIGSSKKDLREFPDEVKQDVGYALFVAQKGGKADSAKPMQGFGGAGVLEIVDDHRGDTYRAVYTVKFKDAIYVLHCFQEKSKHGVKTPPHDIELIKTRLKVAQDDHNANYKGGE